MFVIIGILVVFGAVVAGYLMEHGNLRVLLQPAERSLSVALPSAPCSSAILSTFLKALREELPERLGDRSSAKTAIWKR